MIVISLFNPKILFEFRIDARTMSGFMLLPSTKAPANESPAPVVSIASTFIAGKVSNFPPERSAWPFALKHLNNSISAFINQSYPSVIMTCFTPKSLILVAAVSISLAPVN